MASGEPHDHIKTGVRKGVTVERLELLIEVDGGLHESLRLVQPRLGFSGFLSCTSGNGEGSRVTLRLDDRVRSQDCTPLFFDP
jgi:hypothetical protein